MTTKSKRSQPTKRVTTTERVGPLSVTRSETVPLERGPPWPLLCCIVTACAAFLIGVALVFGQRGDAGDHEQLAHLWRAHVTEHPECRDAETGTDACAECHR